MKIIDIIGYILLGAGVIASIGMIYLILKTLGVLWNETYIDWLSYVCMVYFFCNCVCDWNFLWTV